MKYVLAVDQSTQGTKAVIVDAYGTKITDYFIPHKQIINAYGWVEHDTNEILNNVIFAARNVIEKAKIEKAKILAIALTNQRETVAAWDKLTGNPLCNAIVWQCSRAEKQCDSVRMYAKTIKSKSGLNLSPYFSAAKCSWMLQNVNAVQSAANSGRLQLGTIDSFLVSHLTEEKNFYSDYSNASRTQLFNIHTCSWDEELCSIFGVNVNFLPEVKMSDSIFGHTTLGGYLETPIPICGVLGDSQAALYAQSCLKQGQLKVTYGTGSSVMMQTEDKIVNSDCGLVSSIAWGINNNVSYVLEGNLNYTGAVVNWMLNEAHWIDSIDEAEKLAKIANRNDESYFVPAFTGLSAPYWDSLARGILTGITRNTGRAEMVKAGLECIAYQITDLLSLIARESGMNISEIRADGGPASNNYLMQFQSDITGMKVMVSEIKELSALGVALVAERKIGLYESGKDIHYTEFLPKMTDEVRYSKLHGWAKAVNQVLNH